MNRTLKALLLLMVLVGTYAAASIGPTLQDGGPLPIRIKGSGSVIGPTLQDGGPLPIRIKGSGSVIGPTLQDGGPLPIRIKSGS